VPTAITFDYRGFDTLGEEFILFAAVAGVARILERGREEAARTREDAGVEHEVSPDPSAAVRALARALGAGTLLLGVNVVAHGHLTPAGGFQGGVVLSSAWLLVYLGFGARAYRRVSADAPTDAVEALAAAAYALVGIAGLVAGGAFLANVLPLGAFGQLLSTGTIAVINVAVGCEVAAGFAMLYAYFLDAARTEPPRPG
jgi:multicomponent Na+:H+ antiporter subunit B